MMSYSKVPIVQEKPGSFQPSVYTEESWLGQRSTALSCKNVVSSGPLRRDSPKRLEEAEGRSYTGRENAGSQFQHSAAPVASQGIRATYKMLVGAKEEGTVA